jgi:hypothetical protein
MTPRQSELDALPALLSVSEAAQAAHVSPMTIKRAIKAGKLLKNGASKCYSKITKDSLLVFISLREIAAPVPAPVHDVPINEQYEDLRRCEQRTPEPESVSGEDAAFAAECKHFDDMLPPVECRFVQQHPAPFNFEDYFRAS